MINFKKGEGAICWDILNCYIAALEKEEIGAAEAIPKKLFQI